MNGNWKFARRRGGFLGDPRGRTAALPVADGELPERKFVSGWGEVPLLLRGVIDPNCEERGIRPRLLSRSFDESSAASTCLKGYRRRGHIEQMDRMVMIAGRTGLRSEWCA